tara:strand:- start:100 stop:879 length:780 start_codon:yes stop_codon:yes gene_type:complete
MVIKKIIKAGVKKAIKPRKKGGKVRLPPRPKSAKMKKAQVSLADRKRAAAMAHVRKLEKQGHTKAANKARAWIQQGDAFRRGSGTKKDFNAWAKKAKTLGPSRERLQPKQDKERVKWDGISPKWRAGYTEKGRRDFDWAFKARWVKDPRTGNSRRTLKDVPRRSPPPAYEDHFTKFVPYGSASKPGWAKGFGKKPVRKGPRTVAGLDRDDWFVAGLAGAGPAIGAAYWENKEKINKLPGNAIDVIRDRRDAILRRLGLI